MTEFVNPFRYSARHNPGALNQMKQQNQWEDTPEPAVEDQYISVLLEYYCARQEAKGPSRMDQTKVAYWKGVVSFFEREHLGRFRKQLERQVVRWERVALSPVAMAMLRYAWGAFLTEAENDSEVQARWRRYFSSDSEAGSSETGSSQLVTWEVFRRRRLFEEARRGTRQSGLWPWA